MNSSTKTISLKQERLIKKIEKSLKDIKTGDICKVVFGKQVKGKSECFLRSPEEQWHYIKKNSIVLVIDKRLPKICNKSKVHSKFFSYFVKILYEEQIGFISAGWLEKI